MYLLDCIKDIASQPFVTNGSVVVFDVSVLLRLAGLDVHDGDVADRRLV
jgi:hypothetical protein